VRPNPSNLDASSVPVPALRRERRIEGIAAVLLPFGDDDRPDWESYRRLLETTWAAGLTPAVNMDTGYVNLLSAAERAQVLRNASDVAAGRRFIAGAFIEGSSLEPLLAYRHAVEEIRAHGGTPILFPCAALGPCSEDDVLSVYRRVAEAGGPLLAFELGTMFVPFGRIYSQEFITRLFDIEAFTGLKHSSLDRASEWLRIDLRDRYRPDFRIYTGNDLAIDMAFYGSDYLLGLATFAVEAFAARDRSWAAGDARAVSLNDLLQYLGNLAFRPPVPAYRHSAAQFLSLRGEIRTDRPHPQCPRRPESDRALLDDIRARLEAELARVAP
jgi:dihydrodipicolinate synthase/N-acetylneuraminate lyase